ncbi:MAG: hypothetical protein JW808_04560 [Victivallales bacterium]|nr:hypothetical protein [Victivallales bacterium]
MIDSIKKNLLVKLFVCLALVLLSLSLLGARKVTMEMSSRRDLRELESARWTAILGDLAEEIPAEHRQQWLKLASERPESMLGSLSFSMK